MIPSENEKKNAQEEILRGTFPVMAALFSVLYFPFLYWPSFSDIARNMVVVFNGSRKYPLCSCSAYFYVRLSSNHRICFRHDPFSSRFVTPFPTLFWYRFFAADKRYFEKAYLHTLLNIIKP
jgi:hypothetical protein